MGMLSNPAFGPRVALIYVTVGSLIDVWTGVWWYSYLRGRPADEIGPNTHFWLIGLFLTGLTLIFLGVILGPLGQYARKSELPPEDARKEEKDIQKVDAATPHGVPGMMPGMAPGMMPAGYPVPVMPVQAVPPGQQSLPAGYGPPPAGPPAVPPTPPVSETPGKPATPYRLA